MADGDSKTAAAILACEASRQQLAVMSAKGPRDIPGELQQLFEWFMERVSADKAATRPGAAPRSW